MKEKRLLGEGIIFVSMRAWTLPKRLKPIVIIALITKKDALRETGVEQARRAINWGVNNA